ncbi:type II toxin-antitoxin system VapC family toxin [Kribbella sp. NPDC058245]|uniref:type II toxin-antitoxin system VapC family toxin n=1 Tax=Kribbella sp. NPDC058245 TaxID=3346399 RepID=UPI0036ED5438
MTALLCDSGPLIAMFSVRDLNHERCGNFLLGWSGTLLVPEPVLGETCNFLRNNVRNGPSLEVQLLEAVTGRTEAFEVVDPAPEDRLRAAELSAQLVSGPLGYVDAVILALAERLQVPAIASVDFKFLGMATPVSRLQPLRWVLQEQ